MNASSRANESWAGGPLAANVGLHPRPPRQVGGAPGLSPAPVSPSPDPSRTARFEAVVLSHLDAAYNLARWLTGDEQDARDVVQDACLRAFRAFDGFYGSDGRPWLLTIVRHTCYTWLRKNRPLTLMTPFEEEIHDAPPAAPADQDPGALLSANEDAERLQRAMAALPVEFREVILLRHQEGLSYKQIAAIADLPPGTVMSRLARARARLREDLARWTS